MSYILSALKKAEQQRSSDQGGSRTVIAVPASIKKQQPELPWSKMGWTALLVAGLALGVWVFQNTDIRPTSRPDNPEYSGYEAAPPTITDTRPAEKKTVPAGVKSLPVAPAVKPPALNITGYIFVESHPESSKLFVDGIVYRQGSSPAPGMTILEFRPDTVVIDYRGSRHDIPLD